MLTCKKCNAKFNSSEVIDGKKRVFHKRKYCLSCSPFNCHNTKQLHIKSLNLDKLCTCIDCKSSYVYNRNKGNSTIRCNTCYVRAFRKNIKKQAVAELGGKCKSCGYNATVEALQFHHLDPTKKDFTISSGVNRSWKAIKKEIDKCILLCANCHAEVHAGIKLEP